MIRSIPDPFSIHCPIVSLILTLLHTDDRYISILTVIIEGDGENDGPIKNYKENGNTRTFDAYYPPGTGLKNKAYSVVFVSDGDDKYTISMTIEGYKMTFKTTTKRPLGSGGGDRMQAVKESITKGLNNGIDALKKKQAENKAKKEAKKQAESKE